MTPASFILAYDQGASLPFEGALLPDLLPFLFSFFPPSLHKVTGVTSKHEMMEKGEMDGGKRTAVIREGVEGSGCHAANCCTYCDNLLRDTENSAQEKTVRYSGFPLCDIHFMRMKVLVSATWEKMNQSILVHLDLFFGGLRLPT